MSVSGRTNCRDRAFLVSTIAIVIFTTSALAQSFQAESGTLSGTVVSTQVSGYSGSGYVTGFDADGDQVSIGVNVEAGVYNLYIRYASPFGEKSNFVYVNGDNTGSVVFTSASSFIEKKVGKVFLQAGSNTIAIVKDWGYFHVDAIRLEATTRSPTHNLSSELVTPSPSVRADSLFDLLRRVYGNAIFSGQYGGETEFTHIQTVSGKTPVIRGFDMIDYSPSRTIHGATSTETEKAIEWNKLRGITTFCWHWNAPTDLINEPGKEWWRGFYTEATTFDVTRAMNDQTSNEYGLILRDIDAIAIQLKRLQDANVPVLWRPLHEAEGRWFWWGTKGPESCKWLWKLLFERLVHYHGLDNLIWVWTSTGSPDALNWYPGDAYVDVIGADIYLAAGSYGTSFITFENIASLYGGGKLITLSENGPMPDPEKLFAERVGWSWFCTWSGSYITDGIINTSSHIAKVYNSEYVITLDEIDRIDQIIAALEEERLKASDENVTGIEDSAVRIFPNPMKDGKLILEGIGYPARIAIFNLQGKMAFPEINTVPDQRAEFDFNNKAFGMYLLRIVKPGTVTVYRIIHTAAD